jgi:hypothetical protein
MEAAAQQVGDPLNNNMVDIHNLVVTNNNSTMLNLLKAIPKALLMILTRLHHSQGNSHLLLQDQAGNGKVRVDIGLQLS